MRIGFPTGFFLLAATPAVALAPTGAASAPLDQHDPVVFLYDLYGCTKTKCNRIERRFEDYLSSGTARLMRKVEALDRAHNEVCIDWDVQNDTNAGYRPVRVEVKDPKPHLDQSRVSIDVTLVEEQKKTNTLTYDLVKERGVWRVNDIGYVNPGFGRETIVGDLRNCVKEY